MSAPVIIVDYNPQWPILYDAEKKLICKVLSSKIRSIEHFGSTAVPHLAAKNIIDIMAGVHGADEANKCLAPLAAIGYTDVTFQDGNPDWYYCLGKNGRCVGYHLHLVNPDSLQWKKQILFRDYLRQNPQVAEEYGELKKQLAAKYGCDRLGYTEAKTAFIESTVAKAKDTGS